MNVYVPSHPLKTRHVVAFKTHLFHSPTHILENPNNNNRLRVLVLLRYIQTIDPSTVIQLWLNTSATIPDLVVSLGRLITHQSITNPIPPAMVDSVGPSLPPYLVLPPFRMIVTVIASGKHKSRHRPPDPLGQGVHTMASLLFNQVCHTPINPLLTTSRFRLRRRRSLLTRTNITTITHPTNLRSATARERVDPTRGLTIPSSETTFIITFPPPPTNTPYLFRLRGLLDLRPFKHKPSPAARTDFIITRGLDLQPT